MWKELFPAERERVVRLLIKEIIVGADGLDIRLRTNGLHSLTAELVDGAEAKATEDHATATVHVPMAFKVRGGRKEIILPPEADTTPNVGPRRPVVVALARAYRWQQMLDSSRLGSIDELARKHGVDRSHIGRILKLTGLAPNIVKTILAGREPNGISLTKLHENLPVCWGKQRDRWRDGS